MSAATELRENARPQAVFEPTLWLSRLSLGARRYPALCSPSGGGGVMAIAVALASSTTCRTLRIVGSPSLNSLTNRRHQSSAI